MDELAGAEPLVGATLETVLLGPLLDGRLRYWLADGAAQLAAVDDEARLRRLMARGALARTGPEPGRFREVALLHSDSRTLHVVERLRPADQHGATAAGTQFSLSAADEILPATDLWRTAADWWRDAFLSATARGEFIVIEPGGWAPGSEPFVLAIVRRAADGTWQSYLEAAPVPPGPLWPASTGPGSTIHAPMSAQNLGVSGLLIADAVRGWVATPLDTVITFGTNPDGPVPAEPG